MLRRVKLFTAVLLLPCCFGIGHFFFEIAFQIEFNGMVVAPLVAGIACMVLLYTWLPRPIWTYVLGHEFTHAIASMLCGGRVKGMKVSSEGGHVYVTRDNFFVTLAPYFIPIYTIFVFVLFALSQHALGWGNSPIMWAMFFWALGLSYSFHVFLTAHILRTRQPDIVSQGYLFSAVIIYLGNMTVLLIGLVLVTGGVQMHHLVGNLGSEIIEAYSIIGGIAQNAAISINSVLNSDSG